MSRCRYGWGRGAAPDILTLIGALVVILAVLRAGGCGRAVAVRRASLEGDPLSGVHGTVLAHPL